MTLPVSIHLAIERLQLDLPIGCEAEERSERQPIEVDVCLYMPKVPLGAISDELKDTICYAKCKEIISAAAYKKEYRLIEHLAYEIHSALKKELPMHLEISVKVRKVTIHNNAAGNTSIRLGTGAPAVGIPAILPALDTINGKGDSYSADLR